MTTKTPGSPPGKGKAISLATLILALAIYLLLQANPGLVPVVNELLQTAAPADSATLAAPAETPPAEVGQAPSAGTSTPAPQQEAVPRPPATEIPATPSPLATAPKQSPPDDGLPTIAFDQLPQEAQETIALIDQGGPFPFSKDGSIFQNRERLLPLRPRGYYREYTVITPGEPDRGARRIVAGAGGELYYTDDHYASFKRVIR